MASQAVQMSDLHLDVFFRLKVRGRLICGSPHTQEYIVQTNKFLPTVWVKKVFPETFCNIFTQFKHIFMKVYHNVASSYLHIITNFSQFISTFNKMAYPSFLTFRVSSSQIAATSSPIFSGLQLKLKTVPKFTDALQLIC